MSPLVILTWIVALQVKIYFLQYPLQSHAVDAHSKAGLAWPNGNLINIDQFRTTGKVSWYYTWSASPVNTDLEFVPMFWGQPNDQSFPSTVDGAIATGRVATVLGMNEPQQITESNLTPQQAVGLWLANLQPLKARGLRLGSPAPTSAPNGKTWLLDFLNTCARQCSVDFIAVHWYGTNATDFQTYLIDLYNTFTRPIWVTEWACQNFVDLAVQCSQSEIVNFLGQTQRFMDETPWVERYAWFGAMEDLNNVNPANALMDRDGNINDLGRQYISSQDTGPASIVFGGATLPMRSSRLLISLALTMFAAMTLLTVQ